MNGMKGVVVVAVSAWLGGCAGSRAGDAPASSALTIDSFDATTGLRAHLTVDDQFVLVESRPVATSDGQARVVAIRGADGTVLAERDVDVARLHASGSYDGHAYGRAGDIAGGEDAALWSDVADSFAGHAALAVSRAASYASLIEGDASETLAGVAHVSDALESLAAGLPLPPDGRTVGVDAVDDAETTSEPADPPPPDEDDAATESATAAGGGAAPQVRAGATTSRPAGIDAETGDLAAQHLHELQAQAVSRIFRVGNGFVKVELSGRIWGNSSTHKAAAVGSQQITSVSGHPQGTLRYGYGTNTFYVGIEDLGKGKIGNLAVRGAVNAGRWNIWDKIKGGTLTVGIDGYVHVGSAKTELGVGVKLAVSAVSSGPKNAPRLLVPEKYLIPAAAAASILRILAGAGEFALDWTLGSLI